MSNEILNDLLREYEKKKLNAELDLEKRKNNLYNLIPRLQEIDDEINKLALETTKNILSNSKNNALNDFKDKINKLKEEKKSILLKNNYSLDFLTPFYECKICNDTGFIMEDNHKTTMCSCLKQKLLDISFNKSNIYNIKKDTFNNFNENIYSNEVDLAKYKFNISPRKNILNIKNKAIDFVKNFDNPETKNLLFLGSTGLGKTFMSNCIASSLLEKGKTVIYQTAPVLLETIINYKMSKQKNIDDDFYKSVLECDLLIIDDLGTETINSMKLSELFTILNTRILNLNNKITKTIISTNLNINEIFRNYEERIGSRIVGYYDIYYFFGDDLRFKK